MEENTILTIIVTILGILGSGTAWKFYERRANAKDKVDNFINEDCRKRIEKLEQLLERSAKEKDNMRDEILKLSKLVSELSMKVKFLEEENNDLITGDIIRPHKVKKN